MPPPSKARIVAKEDVGEEGMPSKVRKHGGSDGPRSGGGAAKGAISSSKARTPKEGMAAAVRANSPHGVLAGGRGSSSRGGENVESETTAGNGAKKAPAKKRKGSAKGRSEAMFGGGFFMVQDEEEHNRWAAAALGGIIHTGGGDSRGGGSASSHGGGGPVGRGERELLGGNISRGADSGILSRRESSSGSMGHSEDEEGGGEGGRLRRSMSFNGGLMTNMIRGEDHVILPAVGGSFKTSGTPRGRIAGKGVGIGGGGGAQEARLAARRLVGQSSSLTNIEFRAVSR